MNAPQATIGLDVQWSRTTVVLREGAGDRRAEMLVGDGRRGHVPNAVHGDAWATAAVEAGCRTANGARPAGPGSRPDPVTGWRTDPWEPAFLSGLVRRLADYLGSPPPKLPAGYAAYVLAWPDIPSDAAGRLAAAGLSVAGPAHPGDTLLCRWLSDPGRHQVPDAVVVVAAGERHTTVTRYELAWSLSGRPRQVQRGRTETVAEGCGPWAEALARDLLRRMPEPPGPEVILPLLDAVRELSGAGGERLPWTGPLAERLRSYRVSWRTGEIAAKARPGVEVVTAMVSDLAAPGSQVVLGGPGATWPLLPEALQKHAIVWRSPDPLSDLARGAARWPDYRVLLPPA